MSHFYRIIQDRSIGDIISHDYDDYNNYNDYIDYTDYNDYSDYNN